MLRKSLAVAGVLLFLSLAVKCDPLTVRPTYVSRFEKMVKTLLTPIRNIIGDIRDNIKDLLGRNNSNGTIPAPQTVAEILKPIKDKLRAIYPGTRWCGDGDIADDPEDVGLFHRTDNCCRQHDNCVGGIAAGETRDGLLNNGIFTRSTCDCDSKFYFCLKGARSPVATKIGTTYFNFLRPQCYMNAHPIIRCKSYYRNKLVSGKCAEYEFDYDKDMYPQWFDNPDFI